MLGVPTKTAVWLVILMAASSVLLTAWWGTTPTVQPDTSSYQRAASDLSDLHLDSLQDRTPGYPVVLLLTGSQDSLKPALYFVQLLFHLSAVWIVIALARRFSLPPLASLLLAAVLLSPPLMEKATMGLSEASCELLVTLTALFMVRWTERERARDALLAGFCAAAAALVRPTYQLLGALMAVAALVWLWRRGTRREAVRSAGLFIVGSVLLVGGLFLFNTLRFGYPGLTPLLGWNLSGKTALFVEDLPDSEPAKPVLVEARNQSLVTTSSHTGLDYVWRATSQVAAAKGMDRPEIDRFMVAMNLRLIVRHPIGYAAAVGAAVANYAQPETTDTATGGSGVLGVGFGVIHFGLVLAFFAQLFSVVGLRIARRFGALVRGPIGGGPAIRTWWIALTIVVYTAVLSVTIEVGKPRFRTPTDPLILLLIFGGIYASAVAFRARDRIQPVSPEETVVVADAPAGSPVAAV